MSCRGSRLVGVLEIQNHASGSLVAYCGVHHGVVNGAIRPFDIEILLYIIAALAVDTINQLFSFLFALAAS